MPTLFSTTSPSLHAQAEKLKKRMDNIDAAQEDLRQQARQKLHDFLEQHPEMGVQRYQEFLGQEGPDIRPLPLGQP